MNQLRAFVFALLDKVDVLLTTEPARAIGYGAAVIVFLVVQVLSSRGVLPAMTFDQSVTLAFSAIASTVIIVESIRRFVYSPMTYIEDIADEAAAAHEAAHIEEEMAAWVAAVQARRAADSQQRVAAEQANEAILPADPSKLPPSDGSKN